jgi:AraC-like DNA-binding protein
MNNDVDERRPAELARRSPRFAISRTSERAAGDRFDAFCAAVSTLLLPVALATDDVRAFSGGMRATALSTLQLARVLVANDMAVRRTDKLIERSAPEYLKVALQLTGSCVVAQGDREAVLKPGEYVIYDTTRPYQLWTRGPLQMQTVLFPRNLLRLPAAQVSQLTARPISGRAGLGSMVSSFLVELGKKSTNEFGSATSYLADAVMDLIAASIMEQLTGEAPWDLDAHRSGLLLRVRAFIEDQLGDPDLNVASIAAAHHVSVRYLQKLFEQDGQTVTGWIRDRRIEHCRRDLASAALAETPLHSIAARWGLVNAAHFSRLFKARFGEAPRDYRARALNGVHAHPADTAPPDDRTSPWPFH